MKRIQFIVLLLALIILTGCGTVANIPSSGSNAPPSAAIEEDSDKLSNAAESTFQEGLVSCLRRIRPTAIRKFSGIFVLPG